MKKAVSILLATTLISSFLFAQKNSFYLSAGPTWGIKQNKNYTTAFGGSLKGRYGISKAGSVTSDITFLNTKPKPSYLAAIKNVNIVNIKLGVLSYLNDKSNFFVQADAGISHYSYTGTKAQVTGFVGSAGIGYSFPLSPKSYIDFAPNFNFIQKDAGISRVWFILNLAYRVKITSGKK